MKVLYICSSQFSGSTLASFLMNTHSAVATIGHTMGWKYRAGEDFRCSCGKTLADCRLFSRVARAFAEHGLPYDPRDFGTRFSLSTNARVDQILLASLPLLKVSALERLRDALVRAVPPWRRRLERQVQANRVLMQTVLDELGASVFLDNSHSPYRMRMLAAEPGFDVYPVHLIRDPRGVALSLMTNSGYTTNDAVDAWINHQLSIFRIAAEVRSPVVVYYEALCRDTDAELKRLHEAVGLGHEAFGGDFKEEEHHILGNRMRLTGGAVRLDERWKTDLAGADRALIEARLSTFRSRAPAHPLARVIDRYLTG